jgi:hypothetical protein
MHYKTYQITNLRKHVDADHFIMLTKIEEEVNNAIRRIVEKKPTRRGLMCKSMQYFFVVVVKDLFKHGGYVIKKLCIRPWSFDCEKSPTFLTCGKHLVNILFFAYVLEWSSFLKDNFPKKYCLPSEENKTKICFCQN